ncbi:hypothetical protein SUGI_1194220 [Cryptomeria japonica]|nr:hypothetical protein SUGI_1194220 [Cryptomeria japonica]
MPNVYGKCVSGLVQWTKCLAGTVLLRRMKKLFKILQNHIFKIQKKEVVVKHGDQWGQTMQASCALSFLDQLLQQDFSKSSNQILQQEYSTNLQWNSSKSPDSVLPKQPEWSSFCEVDPKTEILEKCNFIDKKVLMSKGLKEGSGNGRGENLEQQKIQTEQ